MVTQLTENCLSCLENVLARNTKQKQLQHIGIDKEDIFFAWLGKRDEPNWKMTVCTVSFPSYRYASDTMKAQKDSNEQFIKDQLTAIPEGERHIEGGGFRGIPPEKMDTLKQIKSQSDAASKQLGQHMDTNEIIVCNWDFVQEDGEWKIDGITMRKLRECILLPFYYRWKLGLGLSISTGIDYKKVMRFDYGSFAFIFILSFFNTSFVSAGFLG